MTATHTHLMVVPLPEEKAQRDTQTTHALLRHVTSHQVFVHGSALRSVGSLPQEAHVYIEGLAGVIYTPCEVYLTSAGLNMPLHRDFKASPVETVEIKGPAISLLQACFVGFVSSGFLVYDTYIY